MHASLGCYKSNGFQTLFVTDEDVNRMIYKSINIMIFLKIMIIKLIFKILFLICPVISILK